ncbi:MAG: ABC transporter ATP-binding protein [Lachnospiraceae bacterium]|nr:ABC transporter ATP-binding protein [Lachnospiraceae bacterium]
MIEMLNLSKSFEDIKALNDISGKIEEGRIFGLVGTNGAGKSTCLRIMAGVLKPDSGYVYCDGEPIFENDKQKQEIFFIADDPYYLKNATPAAMMDYYVMFYPRFDRARCEKLLETFGLDKGRKIATFSKGMKKQLSILMGICAGTRYLLCDESFDGLDPVKRQAIKSLFALELTSRPFTPVIASHNLRELEDICDHVGLLHEGGLLLSEDLDDMKENLHKVQCVLTEEKMAELAEELTIVHQEKRGSLYTLTIRGNADEIADALRAKEPVFSEVLPLTLEEIFISETEVVGYDIKSLIS